MSGWQISRKADLSSVAGEADCETFRERIGWSIFWKERPQSDRPYSDITCPHSDRPRISIRKEGHWKSQVCSRSRIQHSWSSKSSPSNTITWAPNMKHFKHDDQFQRRLPFYPKILHQEDLQSYLHPFCPSLELLSYDITYVI